MYERSGTYLSRGSDRKLSVAQAPARITSRGAAASVRHDLTPPDEVRRLVARPGGELRAHVEQLPDHRDIGDRADLERQQLDQAVEPALEVGEPPPQASGRRTELRVGDELFGYRRGAFSGAAEDRLGLVRTADGGSLFLDEIAELAPESQAALLRVVQEREVVPVGGTAPVKVDVRIVSATCEDIAALVALGRFRRDLHARIAGFTLALPALRDRSDDLGLLIARIVARRADRAVVKLDRLAIRALFLHDWPENIRELDQLLTAALALGDGALDAARIAHALGARRAAAAPVPLEPRGAPIDRAALSALFEAHRGNVSRVARALGTSRSQIRRLAGRLGLVPEQFRR
jgi:transcriptional regulator of acetoin/glycerol metabolism